MHAEGLGIPKVLGASHLKKDGTPKKKQNKEEKKITQGYTDSVIETITTNHKKGAVIYTVEDDELKAVDGFGGLSKEEKAEVENACVSMDEGEYTLYLGFEVKLECRNAVSCYSTIYSPNI